MEATIEWRSLPPEVRDVFPLPQYCSQHRDTVRFRGDKGNRPQQNNDLSRATRKISLATYDGTSNSSA